MNPGKTLFSQLMDCLPWSTFTRIVARYDGDYDVRTFPCVEQFRPWRSHISAVKASGTLRMPVGSAREALSYGFSRPVRRSTLADANETRDWRIYAELLNG